MRVPLGADRIDRIVAPPSRRRPWADWPLIGGDFTTRGVHVLWPKRLRALLGRSAGGLDVAATAAALGGALPRA
jgi:hypothetical protein